MSDVEIAGRMVVILEPLHSRLSPRARRPGRRSEASIAAAAAGLTLPKPAL
jgi:hypothetical protein